MYDDYDLDYTYATDYSYDLDEYYAQDLDLDEDYARDGQDYETLAYRHYAWYNLVHITSRIMPTAQKRLVQVTLDLMCYDDLDLDSINWRELLQLEGDEEVYPTIRDFSELY
jgi:hypothetical protein